MRWATPGRRAGREVATAERGQTGAQVGSAVLDIGEDIGALIIYTWPELHGAEIEVSPSGASYRVHAAVLARRTGAGTVFAALFLALPADRYTIWRDAPTANTVAVAGGKVAELDWRNMAVALLPKGETEVRTIGRSTGVALRPTGEMDAAPAGRNMVVALPLEGGTDVALARAGASVARPEDGLGDAAEPSEWLPARYRQGRPVCATPMRSAPLRYDGDGRVAWDRVWTDFCDLALAGGPPHRGTLLEPVDPAEILAAPREYALVVAEIERGLRLVTEGLPIVPGTAPGWVGLRCPDERTAAWLARAIDAENVAVRREGVVLSLPAGPRFRREEEIKNVVTVVAKTYHYWREHREG